MKARIALVFGLIVVAVTIVCVPSRAKDDTRRSGPESVVLDQDGLGHVTARVRLIELGGCQYVVAIGGSGGNVTVFVTHHAACTNPIHQSHPSTP
jgi:hypothetical protein